MDLLAEVRSALGERYVVDREVGSGGMAVVFLAHDTKHGWRVAVKVLGPEVAGAIGADRFVREIEIAAPLTHPHILPLHDSGHVGDIAGQLRGLDWDPPRTTGLRARCAVLLATNTNPFRLCAVRTARRHSYPPT